MNHPSELTADEVIPFFLQFARQLLARPVSPHHVLNELIRFYRECRVTGAPITKWSDADTFCIECGNYPKITAAEIGDFRGEGGSAYRSGPHELQMSIHRTVHPVDALPEDSEFDDAAFEMDITLYFGPTDDDASFFLEASTLDDLDSELPRLWGDPLISRLSTQTPTDAGAHVGGAG